MLASESELNRNSFRRKALIVVTGLMLLTSLSMLPLSVYGKNNPKKSVIIGFKGRPDKKLVTSLNGDVSHEFTYINAVSAKVPEHALEKIRKAPGVSFVELDHPVKALGQTLPWGVNHIDAELVHLYNKGAGVKVAVVDTGVDYNHPDIALNYLGGFDYVHGDNNPMDDHGHGTHCAGIVAAVDNDLGVIGVGPEVGIYALKVLDENGEGSTSGVIAGIEWAMKGPDGLEGNEDDADVISLSLGSSMYSRTLEKMCQQAYEKGSLIVAAAGNSGSGSGEGDTVSYPARFDSVIAVAAVGSTNYRASWSSTGPSVELSAPGINVFSTFWDDVYASMSGTSMACPHVSGVAALVMASLIDGGYDLDSDGAWDPAEVRNKLKDTAIDLGASGRDPLYGYGLVYALDAVEASPGEEPQIIDIAVSSIEALSTVTRGDLVDVQVTVGNVGNQDLPDVFTVTLFDVTAGRRVEDKTVNGLSSGSSIILTYQWDSSNTIDQHFLKAVQYYDDYNDGNDWAGTYVQVTDQEPEEPPLMDISVSSVQAPLEAVQGEVVEVNVKVENLGNLELAEPVSISLMDLTDGIEIGVQSINSLAPGSNVILSFQWDTEPSSIGVHVLEASKTPADDNISNDKSSTESTVAPDSEPQSPTVKTLHVGDIDASKKVAGKSGKWSASFTVIVHDNDHKVVEGALVTVELNDGAVKDASMLTDRKGKAKFVSDQTTGQSISLTVKGITFNGDIYDPSLNHDPDGDSDGTTLIVFY